MLSCLNVLSPLVTYSGKVTDMFGKKKSFSILRVIKLNFQWNAPNKQYGNPGNR